MEIEEYCHRLFIQTCVYCAVLILFSLFTVRFALISWLPSLFGSSTEVLPFFVQVLLIIGIVVLAGFNCGKSKICGVLVLAIFSGMVLFGMIFINPLNLIMALIGAAGVAASAGSIGVFLDYRQLENTEGFPYFSYTLTPQNPPAPQPTNTPDNDENDIAAPDPASLIGLEALGDIAEMPGIADAVRAAAQGGGTSRTFSSGKKFCYMAESGIKNK